MDDSYRSPPIVLDTNVLVTGACRHESSLAHELLLGVLEERFPIILTEPIVLEYLDVLARPAIRKLTGLARRQSEELVTDLIALSRKVQLRFSWRPNLRDEGDNKFVEAAIHAAAVIATYNVSDFRSPDLTPHGWTVMTPQEFLARYS
ncbi:MAG: PIN domain-containing protein [Planctomycetes bacterium]|nr:PIN domain-containing protein [Planctomycetota bacterium]